MHNRVNFNNLYLIFDDSLIDIFHNLYKRLSLQVKTTARSIKSILEADETTDLMASPVTSPPAGSSNSPDKAAEQWTTVFCELSRHE
jgi:hypothetical protein